MGFWGNWPRYFEEMPLEDSQVQAAASRCQTAVVVIGRAAGEDRENTLEPGSYYLTEAERKLLTQVTGAFAKTVVLIDSGSIMDLAWLEEYPISAALVVWQGGMESGNAVADVLTGAVTPCGKLTDTISYRYEDHPSASNFLGNDANVYAEDIYVATATSRPSPRTRSSYPLWLWPVLHYLRFGECPGEAVRRHRPGESHREEHRQLRRQGSGAGVCAAPQGVLGKAARVLCAYGKRPSCSSPGNARCWI